MVCLGQRFNLKQRTKLHPKRRFLYGKAITPATLGLLLYLNIYRHKICTELTQLCQCGRDFARVWALVGSHGQHIGKRKRAFKRRFRDT